MFSTDSGFSHVHYLCGLMLSCLSLLLHITSKFKEKSMFREYHPKNNIHEDMMMMMGLSSMYATWNHRINTPTNPSHLYHHILWVYPVYICFPYISFTLSQWCVVWLQWQRQATVSCSIKKQPFLFFFWSKCDNSKTLLYYLPYGLY